MKKPTVDDLPLAYRQFVDLFNREQYWESHEVLETPWRHNRSRFYRGMIIYASAFVHAQRGNPRGVWKQMCKAERYLSEYGSHYMGLDLNDLMRRLKQCKDLVDAEKLARTNQVPPQGEALTRVIPFHRLHLDETRIRGDEVEMIEEELCH